MASTSCRVFCVPLCWPLVLKENVECIAWERCEQIAEIPVPQVAEQCVARLAAVLALLNLKDIFDVVSVVPHVEFFEWICEQIVEVPVPAVWQRQGPKSRRQRSIRRSLLPAFDVLLVTQRLEATRKMEEPSKVVDELVILCEPRQPTSRGGRGARTQNWGGPWPRPVATIQREDPPREKKERKSCFYMFSSFFSFFFSFFFFLFSFFFFLFSFFFAIARVMKVARVSQHTPNLRTCTVSSSRGLALCHQCHPAWA